MKSNVERMTEDLKKVLFSIPRRVEVRQISTGTLLFFDLCKEGG